MFYQRNIIKIIKIGRNEKGRIFTDLIPQKVLKIIQFVNLFHVWKFLLNNY